MTNLFCIQTNGLQLRHQEATPLLCLIMESVVRPFIYFWPRQILSVYPLQLTLTADQQEKIHTAFYVPGLPRKTMRCTHIIQTHSQRHMCMCSSSRFLVILLHQGAGSSRSKWKRAPIKLCRRMPCLQCIIHAERKRDCVWEREKQAEKGKI